MRPSRFEVFVNGKRLTTNVVLPDAPLNAPRTVYLDEGVAILIHRGDELTIFGGYAGGAKVWPLLVDAVVLSVGQPHNGRIAVMVGPKK